MTRNYFFFSPAALTFISTPSQEASLLLVAQGLIHNLHFKSQLSIF